MLKNGWETQESPQSKKRYLPSREDLSVMKVVVLDRLGYPVARQLLAHLSNPGCKRAKFVDAIELIEQMLELGRECSETPVGGAQGDQFVGLAGKVELKLRVLR